MLVLEGDVFFVAVWMIPLFIVMLAPPWVSRLTTCKKGSSE